MASRKFTEPPLTQSNKPLSVPWATSFRVACVAWRFKLFFKAISALLWCLSSRLPRFLSVLKLLKNRQAMQATLRMKYKTIRGGWPGKKLHYGLILQFASVDTISHCVQTSAQATQDPLKSDFFFRCN